MRNVLRWAAGVAVAVVALVLLAPSAGAAQLGPLDLSLDVEPTPGGGVQVAPSAGVTVPGVTRVGVDTSVGVSPTDGVDAKVDAGVPPAPVHVEASLPLSGDATRVEVSLPPLVTSPAVPDRTPTPGDATPSEPTVDRVSANGPTTLAGSNASGVRAGGPAPATASPNASAAATGAVTGLQRDIAAEPTGVTATLRPPRRGMWSSLGHAAGELGPWIALLIVAAVVEIAAATALRDHLRRRAVCA
jgi:hypothetical protein